MNREQKKRLRTLILLSLALLVSGTFAFTAFNQQVLNDRANAIRTNVTGRIHDYYNRDTENKDVFAENYGQNIENNEIMVRIRLSEFMEIQRRGETDFTPVVDTAEREDISTWTTYLPEAGNLNARTGNSAAFNHYSRLTFGWQREGQDAPWYMLTFNRDHEDLRTAAAGHARDYIQGNGATDANTDGTTHPGEGTDAYWSSGDHFDNGAGIWPGETISQNAAQHLRQERPPMTIQQWSNLTIRNRVGNYWVIDHNTGWAYWAKLLEPGQATSYLLDAAEMTEEVVKSIVNGYYYYAIHVDSQSISPLEIDRFLAEDSQGAHDTRLVAFLEGVRNGFYGEDGNPPATANNPPSEFQFQFMRPGRIFTMSGQQYRYLENMGEGYHMIIRNTIIPNTTFTGQVAALNTWYGTLQQNVRDIVVPVSIPNPAPSVHDASIAWQAGPRRWLPSNLETFPTVWGDRTDRTLLNPGGEGLRAFSLSLSDVVQLSGAGKAFPTLASRAPAGNLSWWLRTPGVPTAAWNVRDNLHDANLGELWGTGAISSIHANRGVRPALVIRQQP